MGCRCCVWGRLRGSLGFVIGNSEGARKRFRAPSLHLWGSYFEGIGWTRTWTSTLVLFTASIAE
jgi:hypothetical protein